ncbi:MAG: nitrous oxide reductase family maturation protein NosD [Promethearchaeota archaeon]
MKNKNLFILVSFFAILIVTFTGNALIINKPELIEEKEDLYMSSTFTSSIVIDDLPGSLNNWSWAKSYGYCTGSGTKGSPYVIENHIFDNSLVFNGICLTIMNSQKYFIIRNCHFIGTQVNAGIQLYNVTNGIITKNSNSIDIYYSITVYNSSYNSITYNNFSKTSRTGIFFDGSYGDIRNNIISNNLLEENVQCGIEFGSDCYFNEIYENKILNNMIGITLAGLNNNVSENKIQYNDIGLGCVPSSNENTIYLNCFENSTYYHAMDQGLFNKWDNGIKGNYWDNYTGPDADENGIGDVPYNIYGSAGTQDNFPLMKCPLSAIREIPGYNILIIFSLVSLITFVSVYIAIKKKKLVSEL